MNEWIKKIYIQQIHIKKQNKNKYIKVSIP